MGDTEGAGRGASWWILQATGWLFLAYLSYAQLIPAFDYDLGVRMGTQEPASKVTEVGVAYWWAFGFGDLATYAPLLAAGLIGHAMARGWGRIVLSAAMGITVYWPVVSLAAVYAAQDAEGWALTDVTDYWIVLPIITAWGLWCLWYLAREE